MGYIVEKIGMNRTVGNPSIAVALLKIIGAKVCGMQEGGKALVAHSKEKANSRYIASMQKKYNLSTEFNKFATLEVANTETGGLDGSPLNETKILKVSSNSKGRGYSGVMKRHNFGGGPASHEDKFHRGHGSIGDREWPGRVQPDMKMAGHYGNTKVSAKSEFVSYDTESKILVLKSAVPGFNGIMGRVGIAK